MDSGDSQERAHSGALQRRARTLQTGQCGGVTNLRLTLGLRGPNLDPNELSRLMCVEPARSFGVGEARQPGGPAARGNEGGIAVRYEPSTRWLGDGRREQAWCRPRMLFVCGAPDGRVYEWDLHC